jgi:hypothetical protein
MVELGCGAGEMYDLKNDQSEMDNLFGRAEHRAAQEQLQALVAARPGPISDISLEPVGLA